MGSYSGTCEIVEAKEDQNSNPHTERKPPLLKQTRISSLEDDINKLLAINLKKPSYGTNFFDQSGSRTPNRNPSKKPMRTSMSSSSGIGFSDPVSLKQALRGLCLSQASEMAALKRMSKPPGSPSISESGRSTSFYRSVVVETGESDLKGPKIEISLTPEESKSNHIEKVYPDIEESKSKIEPVKEEYNTIVIPNKIVPSTIKLPTKSSAKLRRKSKLQNSSSSSSPVKLNKTVRVVKPPVKTKNFVKKKLKQDSPSPKNIEIICQKCHCTLKEEPVKEIPVAVKEPKSTVTPDVSPAVTNKNKNAKSREKGEFSQSSKSSMGDYSSSTSMSEESQVSGSSLSNRPHMSKDLRWEAIHHVMKSFGFLGLRHFNLLKKLGCGDIGTVYLAQLIGTNCLFAIKVMDIEFLGRRKKMPRAQTEREILKILDHPFLPTLYAHFVSDNLSCLVMEYCPGGDLHVLRQKQPSRYFPEQAARFYVAEVLLALEYLHMLGVVYRDLKPENILVRDDGHIMLTDFDLSLRCSVNPTLLNSPSSINEPPRLSGPCAGSNCIDPFCINHYSCQASCFTPKLLKPKPKPKPAASANAASAFPQLVAEPTEARSNSFVGTHEYLAPEIIKGEGHGSAVDWWTFGVFLYELLYGKTPFKGNGNDETLANVVMQNLRFPDTPIVSFQARDLIRGLLVKEPENRLGSERGAAEIKQHPFFEGLNWALIRCAFPPQIPEPYDIRVSKIEDDEVDEEGEKKYLEFELF